MGGHTAVTMAQSSSSHCLALSPKDWGFSAVTNRNHWTGLQVQLLEGRKPREVGSYDAYPEKQQIVSGPQIFLELCTLHKEPTRCFSPPSAFRETSFHSGILQTPDSTISGTTLDPEHFLQTTVGTPRRRPQI